MLDATKTTLLSASIIALLNTGCAPRPDESNSAEMARVFGECSFKLNTTALGLDPLPDTDPRVTVIQEIVDNLVASRYQQLPWKIKTTVLENPAPNAFTTGGGYLGAFSGVYAMADTEAALAGVIAHEIAHMEKLDNMELAGYLEEMLAQQFIQDGIEDYDTGQALKTIVDFCLAIPGLVSFNWKQDIVTDSNNNISELYGDKSIPFVPFTFSEDPESPYSSQVRDPSNTTRISTCNNKSRDTYDEFVVINPEFYFQQYPNAESLPEIPEDITSGPGGLPGTQSLWAVNPWVAFQHTAFSRYAECQSDEAGMLNLLASGYNPLALNSSFQAIIDLFEINEKETNFLFETHPALGQRIEDNRTFLDLNADVLPTSSDIEANPSDYIDYIVMTDRVNEFENLRDSARNMLNSATLAKNSATGSDRQDGFEDYHPITIADIAILLNKGAGPQNTAKQQASSAQTECQRFESVYSTLTGKAAKGCNIR